MTTADAGTGPRSRTVTGGAAVSDDVVRGTLVLSLAVVPLVFGLPHDRGVGGVLLPLLAMPLLGVAGLLVLDRHPGSRRGWACVLAAPLPCLVVALTPLTGLVGTAPATSSGEVGDGFAAAAQLLGPGVLLALLLPVLPRPDVGDAPGDARTARRWRAWTALLSGSTALLAGVAWVVSPTAYGVVATLGVGTLAGVVATSVLGRPPRPVAEPLLDLALVVLVVACGAVSGGAVLAFARHESIVGPEVLGGLAGVATLALAAPAGLVLRRELLRRRYGSGRISPDDVETFNRVLVAGAEPRALLDRAAAVVVGLSGVAEAAVLLDEASRPGWTSFPLRVAEHPVGTLLVRPTDPEGLEDRQSRSLDQLVPTLALAVRAVALAVDAEHARRDAVRQRELERARILADLHDDLGPVLAGMGMRVEALMARGPTPELRSLAADLAGCRSELRRIVEDLTPPPLAEHDLPWAVARLVRSFDHGVGPEVTLTGPVPRDIGPRVAPVVYRVVAEGLTNAVRHGRPSHVAVSVRREAGQVRVCVRDDGSGALVVAGLGLSSLRARARSLGGGLEVRSAPDAGTTLTAWMCEPLP